MNAHDRRLPQSRAPPPGPSLIPRYSISPLENDMTAEEFNEAAEIYDNFAQYDREGMVALVGHLVLHLIENRTLDRDAFLARLDGDIASDPDSDDQISQRLAELKELIGRKAS